MVGTQGAQDQAKLREEMESARSVFKTSQVQNLQAWQEAFHSQVPEVLYHYTSATGLTGILESQSLWASDVRFMNDASEFVYASDLIKQTVREVLDPIADERLRPLIQGMDNFATAFEIGFLRPFCACLCEEGDLLSQWRGYTRDALGYSLGLDLVRRRLQITPSEAFLRKVVYDKERQHAWIQRITQTWLNSAQNWLDSIEYSRISPFVIQSTLKTTLEEALLELYLCFKNPAFQEEKEWRLIMVVALDDELQLVEDQLRSKQDEKRRQQYVTQYGIELPQSPRPPIAHASLAKGIDIQFRPTRLGFVPYILLNLEGRTGVFAGRFPLPEVLVGPTENPDLTRESLTMYLRKSGYIPPLTNIRNSSVPFR